MRHCYICVSWTPVPSSEAPTIERTCLTSDTTIAWALVLRARHGPRQQPAAPQRHERILALAAARFLLILSWFLGAFSAMPAAGGHRNHPRTRLLVGFAAIRTRLRSGPPANLQRRILAQLAKLSFSRTKNLKFILRLSTQFRIRPRTRGSLAPRHIPFARMSAERISVTIACTVCHATPRP
jgi:hypothetical protein